MPYLKPSEAAALLGVSRRQLIDLVNSGKLPCVQLSGRTWRFHQEDLERIRLAAIPPSSEPQHPDLSNQYRGPDSRDLSNRQHIGDLRELLNGNHGADLPAKMEEDRSHVNDPNTAHVGKFADLPNTTHAPYLPDLPNTSHGSFLPELPNPQRVADLPPVSDPPPAIAAAPELPELELLELLEEETPPTPGTCCLCGRPAERLETRKTGDGGQLEEWHFCRPCFEELERQRDLKTYEIGIINKAFIEWIAGRRRVPHWDRTERGESAEQAEKIVVDIPSNVGIDIQHENAANQNIGDASQTIQAGLCPTGNGNERADPQMDRGVCEETQEVKICKEADAPTAGTIGTS